MDDSAPAADSSRPSTSVVKSGDRKMFTVELRPGETTIVSWKKLVKDTTSKVNNALPPAAAAAPAPPPANAHPNLESRLAPVQPSGEGEEGKDEAVGPSRFSAVIEKIERLYMGKDSSDDEDQNIPDDDQYDTEDSFIDDKELDEYFEVDNSAIKHDGFFVNRGQLERLNTTAALPNQQPKKRRREDSKSSGGNDDGHLPNKQAMLGSDREASALLVEVKSIDKPKSGSLLPKDSSNRYKDAGGSSDSLYPKYQDKSPYSQTKTQSVKLSSNTDVMESSVPVRAKNGIRQIPDLNISDVKYSVPTTKISLVHRKEGSSVRPKGSMLEKAIRELERMVAESRPPTMANGEGDNSSQAIKRRLPREIKIKLDKVARLAQASHGKISKELLNRLMSSLGHLIQLRTLKRNMKVMISTGISDKKEKDDRFQQIKKEVIDMVKINASSLGSKALNQQAGSSHDFQDTASGSKEVTKRKFSMDPVLEDKICELYDLYADGLDEDAGPQIRKLYAELAGLWPSGCMNNHGIKSAIYRAKDRRRERYSQNKDEKMRRRKMLTPKVEESVRVEASSMPQQQSMQDRLATEPGSHGSGNKSVSGTSATARIPSPINSSSFDRLKQEKLKGSASNSSDDARVGDGGPIKKKVKRKPEQELVEPRMRPVPSPPGEERQKSFKQATGVSHKSNHQPTSPSSVE